MSEAKDKNEPSLAELGEMLRKTREEKEVPLRAYADQLKIRLNYLEAIEKATSADLPGQVFYIAFAKSYATMLGIEGEKFSAQVRSALLRESSGSRQKIARFGLTLSDPRNLMRVPVPSAAPSLKPIKLSPGKLSGERTTLEKRTFLASLPSRDKQVLRERVFNPFYIAGGMIALALLYLGGVILLDLIQKSPEERSAARSLTESKPIPRNTGTAETSEPAEELNEQKVYGALGGARVVLRARESCWIAVFATENSSTGEVRLLFAGNLNKGDRYRVPVQLGIILKSGNLDALDFFVQDNPLNPFRIENPSGFMSLEPAHLRDRTAVREGNALAREKLPVVKEIELLRELRGQEALNKEDL